MSLRIASVVLATIAGAVPIAQERAPSQHFDVVSIKLSKADDATPSFRPSPSGRFEWQNMTLEPLVSVAYQQFAYDEVEVVGMPDWAGKERFNIIAQTGSGTPRVGANGFPAELAAMIRNMLADRFHLAAHREKRDKPAYLLQAVRPNQLGPQLTRVDEACGVALAGLTGGRAATARPGRGPDCSFDGGTGRMQGDAVSIEMISRVLGRLLSRPVVDRTGLTGSFDLDLRYRPELTGAAADAGTIDADVPGIFTAIQEQLGLRLVNGRASVDVLVVDAVERPIPD